MRFRTFFSSKVRRKSSRTWTSEVGSPHQRLTFFFFDHVMHLGFVLDTLVTTLPNSFEVDSKLHIVIPVRTDRAQIAPVPN
jgi:hypothetical protein